MMTDLPEVPTKPVPDGSVTIKFHHGFDETWEFADGYAHQPEGHNFYTILHRSSSTSHTYDSRIVFPLMHIERIIIKYNSSKFFEDLNIWSEAAHPQHEATNDLDGDCGMCQIILAARAEMGSIN